MAAHKEQMPPRKLRSILFEHENGVPNWPERRNSMLVCHLNETAEFSVVEMRNVIVDLRLCIKHSSLPQFCGHPYQCIARKYDVCPLQSPLGSMEPQISCHSLVLPLLYTYHQ